MIALILALFLQDDIVKESTHELDAQAIVTVRTVTGRVRLRGTDKSAAQVRTVKRGRDRELVEIRVEAAKDKLTIETHYPDRRGSIEVEIEIDVDVPKSAKSLGVEVVSGSIEVKDAAGESRFTTVSGSLNIDGLQGSLTATTISGAIRIAKLSGTRAFVSMTSGSLEGAGEVGELEIKSVSGRVSFDMTPKGAAWSLKASCISGNMLIRLPESAGAKIDLKTMSGTLASEFELKDEKRSGRDSVDRSLRGTFGDGAGSIRASTISGDVKVGRVK